MVVDYYRHLLEELRKALPYDAMGGQHTIPILVLQEFRKPDIVEKSGILLDVRLDFPIMLCYRKSKIYDRTSGPAGNYSLYGRIGKPAGGKECLQTGRTNVVKERVLAVPDTGSFYCGAAGKQLEISYGKI